MLLKQNTNKFFSRKSTGIKFFLILSVFITYSLVMFAFGFWTYRYELVNKKPLITEIKSVYEKVSNLNNYFQGLTDFSSPLEIIKIDIKHKDFQRLEYDRQVAFDRGRLLDNDFVSAGLFLNDQVYKIKIRLKGDDLDHLSSPTKWSFRVEIKDEEKSLMGMKKFSLQSPKTRNYLYEWLYHQLLKREDVIGLKYDFIKLYINGKSLGIYAIEEHFDKVLIESNHRREGPILKFSEDIFWKEDVQSTIYNLSGGRHPSIIEFINPASESDFSSSNIEAFKTKSILKKQNLKNQFIYARDLLELFRRGELKTSQVFDIDRLAKFFVISEMTRTLHGAFGWTNIRFYYNPITSLLEPIGFDGQTNNENINSMWNSERIQNNPEYNSGINFYLQIFNDMKFFEKYIYYVEKYSEPKFFDDFFDDFEPLLKEKLSILYKDFPQIDSLEKMKLIFKETQSLNRILIDPVSGINAYEKEYLDGNLIISIGNSQAMPIEIIGIKLGNGEVIPTKSRLILKPKLKKSTVKYFNFDFKITESNYSSNLNVIYRVLGASKLYSSSIFPYPITPSSKIDLGIMSRLNNLSEFKFIQVNELKKNIIIYPGKWEIDKDLIIPSGYTFNIGKDTHINLSNGATILSYSPLNFTGEAQHPITIRSLDGHGQGLSVINAKKRSFLEFVYFDNLASPLKENWSLSGAVNFYESPVSLSNVIFENSNAEDALNIIRSNFLIQNSSFRNNKSDSFDGDFVEGIIMNTIFERSGNDAIDVSGSIIKIDNVEIKSVNDKAISVGENSNVKVFNTKISDSYIAVASKDTSSIIGNDLSIENSNIAFTAYQKKSEFGPASISIDKLKTMNVEILYMVENKSQLIIDGNPMESNSKLLYETLYGQ